MKQILKHIAPALVLIAILHIIAGVQLWRARKPFCNEYHMGNGLGIIPGWSRYPRGSVAKDGSLVLLDTVTNIVLIVRDQKQKQSGYDVAFTHFADDDAVVVSPTTEKRWRFPWTRDTLFIIAEDGTTKAQRIKAGVAKRLYEPDGEHFADDALSQLVE